MPRKQQRRKEPTQALRVKALLDLWAFFDLISYHGGSSSFADFHKEAVAWSDNASSRQLVLMPRGHLKSTIFTVGKILWRIYQNPNIRIFVGTANKFLSASFIRELKTYFEDQELQESVWNCRPHIEGLLIPVMDKAGRKRRSAFSEEGIDTESEDKKIVWRGDAIQVIRSEIYKEPTVTVGSVGSVATGFHYDELYLDDVVTFDNVATSDKNNRVFSWIYDLESVLDPMYFDDELFDQIKKVVRGNNQNDKIKKACQTGDTVQVVGTRYDKLDYYAHIIDNAKDLGFDVFQRNIYANGVNTEEGYLWKERFDTERERKLRSSLTARRFASQYLNSILAEEDKVLRYENTRFIHPNSVSIDPNVPGHATVTIDDKKQVVKLCLAIDPAAATSKDADYTAIAVGGTDSDGNLIILDVKLGKWLIKQWVKEMYTLLDKWNMNVIHVETAAFQKTLVQTIRSFFGVYRPIAIVEYKPGNLKKEVRIEQTLSPLFDNHMIFFSVYLGGLSELVDQITFFPRKTMKDDGVDAISMVKEISKPAPKKVPKKTRISESRWNRRYGGSW